MISKILDKKRFTFLLPYFLVTLFFIIIPTIFLIIKAFTKVGDDFDN
jgi:ABC-type uncharacterized transport system permease subunit